MKKQSSQRSSTPRAPHPWQQIRWPALNAELQTAQARLVEADRRGNLRDVFRLQDQLVRSEAARRLAVQRIATSNGRHTPGVDQAIWKTPQDRMQASEQLSQITAYEAQPARRVFIPKEDGRQRPLGILTLFDRAMQALFWFALDPLAETRADPHSYGFRQYRSTADAIGRLTEILNERDGPAWVLDADIEQCFDTISHQWLLEHIPMEQRILRQWLHAGYVEKGRFQPTNRGLPQGGVLSPALANMTLDGLERLLREHFQHSEPMRQRSRVEIVRFADDFIVTGASKRLLHEEIQPLLASFLEARGMVFSQTKTRLTSVKQGFDFLGFHVQKATFGPVRVTPAAKRISAVLDTLRNLLAAHPEASPAQIIARLTPVLRGWTNYYDHVDSRAAFAQMDADVAELLVAWAKKRHPDWLQRKASHRYFQPVKGQPLCLTDDNGQRIFRAAGVPARTHVPIDPACNAYDRQWAAYCAQRKTTRTAPEDAE